MHRLWARDVDPIRVFEDSVLRAPVRQVTDFGQQLQSLIQRLLRAQKRNKAIGVAAPQIGEPWNVFVIDGARIQRGGKPEVYVNPRVHSEEGHDFDEEGCLSFPDIFVAVPRPARVTIVAQDADGRPFEREATGLWARAYCHETDHLNGCLIIDRVSPSLREKILQSMKSRGSTGQGQS